MLLVIFAPLIKALVAVIREGVYALYQGLAFLIRLVYHIISTEATSNSPISALLGCAISTVFYVSFLYLWQGLPRNHPATIKRRMLSAGAACCISWVPLAISMTAPARDQIFLSPSRSESLSAALGLRAPLTTTQLLVALAGTLTHTAVLFALPLVHKLQTDGPALFATLSAWVHTITSAVGRRDKTGLRRSLLRPFADDHLWLWRNLLAAPVTEEFVFRACMAPLLMRAVMIQFLYTTVFGWYATYLFVYTGSLWCPVVSHALCNWLGVPDFKTMSRTFGVIPVAACTAVSVAGFFYLL